MAYVGMRFGKKVARKYKNMARYRLHYSPRKASRRFTFEIMLGELRRVEADFRNSWNVKTCASIAGVA